MPLETGVLVVGLIRPVGVRGRLLPALPPPFTGGASFVLVEPGVVVPLRGVPRRRDVTGIRLGVAPLSS